MNLYILANYEFTCSNMSQFTFFRVVFVALAALLHSLKADLDLTELKGKSASAACYYVTHIFTNATIEQIRGIKGGTAIDQYIERLTWPGGSTGYTDNAGMIMLSWLKR